MDAFYAVRSGIRCPVGDVLVLTADAKGVVMRPDALREPTRRAAAGSVHKMTTRLSRGEKTGRKLDEADWAIHSTGVLDTDPPLVVDTLTFTIPDSLGLVFEYLTTIGSDDADTLADFVAEASGVEFDSFGSVTTIPAPASSEELSALVGSLLGNLVDATGIALDGGDLAAILADLRLPVFGSQLHDSKPIKKWGEGTGTVLMSVGVLAGTHGPALLILAGPAGAILTLGTYTTLGGIWVVNKLRNRRQTRRAARAATTPPATPTTRAIA